MTRDEAQRLVSGLLHKYGAGEAELNQNGILGLMLGAAQIYFHYLPESQSLRTHALIFKFDEEPPETLIERFSEAADSGEYPTGGGSLEYLKESKGLYLSRADRGRVNPEKFIGDVENLGQASLVWSRVAFEQILESLRP